MADESDSSSTQSPSTESSESPPSDSSSSSSSSDDSSPSSPPPSSPPPSPPSEEDSSPPPPSQESSNTPSTEGDSSNADNGGNEGTKGGSKTPEIEPGSLAPPGGSFNPPSPALNSGSHSHSRHGSKHHHNSSSVVVGIVIAGGIVLVFMLICMFCMKKKKKKGAGGWDTGATKPPQDHVVKMPPSSGYGYPSTGSYIDSSGQQSGMTGTSLASSPSLTLGFNKSTFTYDELAAATNGFAKEYMLGQGGFGFVHKGVLPNGKEIAVKSLKAGSGQGEREFQAEVEIISRVHHRHLVSLVGYCIADGQRMLVYEFMPNDTLDFHLHKKGELDFPTRLRIALGGAKGLAYLHEDCHPRIIHRDIKASNILLDENYEAMVADFGLAKLTTDTNTHVSTRVMGTFGYLAPEYAASGKLTEKSDVFSFGVMLLEIITGRRPVDPNMKYMEDSLVDWCRPLLAKSLETGDYHEFADPRLEGNFDPHLMKRLVACAAAAVRHSAKRRPKMSQIVRALEGDVSLDDLNDGAKAGMLSSSEASSDYDTRAYNEDLKKFRQMAFETKDFASSEYGGTTSEYTSNQSSGLSDNSMEMMH